MELELIVRSLPDAYVERTLQFTTKFLNTSHHIEFYVNWSNSILTFHGPKNILSQQSLTQVILAMSNEVVDERNAEESDDENLLQPVKNGGVDSEDEEMAEASADTDDTDDDE
ncbi:Periodic tryptophan protein 2 like [Pseudolycoriella hygida]|uniref:Periodic tryptophan protein 2 like n=1 Tax=Pseudolycoriella hygida TaxID=35572 RepID=A0A9Q0S731_9DIPT|nr:Periodic tryptophan protein 2 like [Pseudolycoriella hygida]